jgi:hypothetical protein
MGHDPIIISVPQIEKNPDSPVLTMAITIFCFGGGPVARPLIFYGSDIR